MITFNLCHSLLLLRWHSTEAGCDTNQRKFQNDYLPCQHFLWPAAAAEEQPNLCLLFQRLGLLSLRSSNLLAGKFLCNPLRDNENLGKSQARKSNIGMGFVTVFPFSNRVHCPFKKDARDHNRRMIPFYPTNNPESHSEITVVGLSLAVIR